MKDSETMEVCDNPLSVFAVRICLVGGGSSGRPGVEGSAHTFAASDDLQPVHLVRAPVC